VPPNLKKINKKSCHFSLSTISANGKVKLTRINVCPNYIDIIVAIRASVFVVKADAMHKLVNRGARLRGITGRSQVDLMGLHSFDSNRVPLNYNSNYVDRKKKEIDESTE
jgi:hypothetical protein